MPGYFRRYNRQPDAPDADPPSADPPRVSHSDYTRESNPVYKPTPESESIPILDINTKLTNIRSITITGTDENGQAITTMWNTQAPILKRKEDSIQIRFSPNQIPKAPPVPNHIPEAPPVPNQFFASNPVPPVPGGIVLPAGWDETGLLSGICLPTTTPLQRSIQLKVKIPEKTKKEIEDKAEAENSNLLDYVKKHWLNLFLSGKILVENRKKEGGRISSLVDNILGEETEH